MPFERARVADGDLGAWVQGAAGIHHGLGDVERAIAARNVAQVGGGAAASHADIEHVAPDEWPDLPQRGHLGGCQ